MTAFEYKRLASHYPFDRVISGQARPGEPVNILDVGCGTGIFPTFLEDALSAGVELECDLLDISAACLRRSAARLKELPHFSTGKTYHSLIEDIPQTLSTPHQHYDMIWAMHSFTTVEVTRMEVVYQRLIELLRPSGRLLIYQLATGSAYQTLHARYRTRHPHGRGVPPYMSCEESTAILDHLSAHYRVLPLAFEHPIPADQPELLAKYLRKVVLDESVEIQDLFTDLLEGYLDSISGEYRFPQQVNLIEVGPVRDR